MLALQTVQTVGINWTSVLTLTCLIVGALSIILGFFARAIAHYVTNSITTAIDRFRIDVIESMDKRVTSLEAQAAAARRNRR